LVGQADAPFLVLIGQAAVETVERRRDLGDGGWQDHIADAEFVQRYTVPPQARTPTPLTAELTRHRSTRRASSFAGERAE